MVKISKSLPIKPCRNPEDYNNPITILKIISEKLNPKKKDEPPKVKIKVIY